MFNVAIPPEDEMRALQHDQYGYTCYYYSCYCYGYSSRTLSFPGF